MAKTLRSRIAAVAVVTLGLGLLSAAPASAVTNATRNVSVASTSPRVLTPAADGVVEVTTVSMSLVADSALLASSDTVVATLSGTGFAFDTATATNGAFTGTSTAKTLTATGGTSTATGTVVLTFDTTGATAGTTYYAYIVTSGDATGDASPVVTVSFKFGNVIDRTLTASATTGAALRGGSVSFTATDAFTAKADTTSTMTVTGDSDLVITVTPGTATGGAAAALASNAYTTVVTNTKNAIAGSFSVVNTINVSVLPGATLGTHTITVSGGGTGGVAPTSKTYTLTVNPTIYTYAYSTVATADSSTSQFADSDGIVYAPKTNTGTAIATLTVSQKDTGNNTISVSAYTKAVTVTLTGVGSLSDPSSGASSAYKYVPAGSANGQVIYVYADGRAGTGTVTVAVDGVTVKTRVFKFFGVGTKITVTPVYTIGVSSLAGGTTGSEEKSGAVNTSYNTAFDDNDSAITVVVTDANGTPVPALTGLSVTSSDLKVVSSVTHKFVDSGNVYTDGVYYGAGVFAHHYTFTTPAGVASGSSASLTWTYVASDATVVTSTPVTITTGGAVDKVTLTLDKASYTPGEKATLTVTAVDASGKPAYDGQTVLYSLSSNLVLGTALTNSSAIIDGKKVKTIYAPSVAGEWKISGYDINGAAISVTAKVTNSDLDAVKADVAKTQAAIATLTTTITGIQTAISTLVASVTATLTSMSASINKIMKKLKIK